MNQLRAQDEQGSAGNEQVCPPIAAESSVSAEVEWTFGNSQVANNELLHATALRACRGAVPCASS